MKKLITLTVLLILALGGVSIAEQPGEGSAAVFDFTRFSYDELIGIKEQLDNELQTRPEAGARILQPGQYVVGKDIAQGIYDVGFVPAEEDDTYTNWYIYDTKQMYDYDVSRLYLGDLPRNEGRVQTGSSVKVELFDGDYFVIYRSAASIERSGNAVPVEYDYTAPEGTSIPTGIYIIGEEIPAGKYTIWFNGEAPSRVRTYANPEDATNDFIDPEFEAVLAIHNPSVEANLKEGYAFRLEYNNVIMKKSEGFVFD